MHQVDGGASVAGVVPGAARSVGSLANGLVAGVFGVAPHVLHHVGPLAGTALLAGTGGTILFGFAGFALSVPMLLRLQRRFGSWAAPAVASVIFAIIYLLSSLVVGPAITGSGTAGGEPADTPVPSGHEDHH
jgi:hypothetical protein